jgi:CpeT protein
MRTRFLGPVVAGALLSIATSCAGAGDRDDLSLAVSWLTGSFTSAAQAAADSNYFEIRLTIVPVWTGRADGHWLYVEQAAAGQLERPYRQRVYHVTAGDSGVVTSEVFAIPAPLRFAGAWRDDAPLVSLTPDSLDLREGCGVVLRRTGEGVFEGGTVGEGCESELRGAAYATSVVELTPDRLTSWDRGFGADGRQVWGAPGGPYVFDRIAEDQGNAGKSGRANEPGQ